jgi:iron(III) transport system substrate-binding protein
MESPFARSRGNAMSMVIAAVLGLVIVGGIVYTVMFTANPPDVVIYTALDEPHSEPILAEFERETGLKVKMIFDQEATKTVGLVSQLVEEQSNPKCDVFWNNELVHTIRLKRAGITAPYRSKSAEDIPAEWKDAEGHWTGFAARARVFILNTEAAKQVQPDEGKWPKSTADLLDPMWSENMGMAEPLAGTTLTHMAWLWSTQGPEYVKDFWTRLREHKGRITRGNAHLMQLVSEGGFAFGYTDTDDYRKAELRGDPVRRIFPDQEKDGKIVGCLVIPNSVALIKGGPNPENGKKLIDYILSKKVEERLAFSASAQMPVRASVKRPDYVRSAEELVTPVVDWEKVADAVGPSTKWLKEFLGK